MTDSSISALVNSASRFNLSSSTSALYSPAGAATFNVFDTSVQTGFNTKDRIHVDGTNTRIGGPVGVVAGATGGIIELSDTAVFTYFNNSVRQQTDANLSAFNSPSAASTFYMDDTSMYSNVASTRRETFSSVSDQFNSPNGATGIQITNNSVILGSTASSDIKDIAGNQLMRRSKYITASRDISDNTGSVVYSGFGFKPISLTGSASAYASANAAFAYTCYSSICDSSFGQSCVFSTNYGLGYSITDFFVLRDDTGVDYQVGTVTAFDYDTVTISWVKTGSGSTPVALMFLAQG